MGYGLFRRNLRCSRLPCIDGRWLAVGLSVLALSLPASQAAPIEFHYGGTITSAGAGTNVAVGSRFDGTFTYDPQANLSPMLYENGRTYTFGQPSGTTGTTTPDSSAMSLTLGGSSAFSKSGGLSLGLYEVDSNDPYNPNPATNLTFNSYNPSTKVDLEVLLSNPQRGVFGSLAIPPALNLSNFPTATVTVSWWDPTRKDVDSYVGTIDTLAQLGTSVTTVPEPAAVALWLGLGAAGWAFRARMRSSM